MALAKCVEQIGKAFDFEFRVSPKPGQPFVERRRVFRSLGAIGTKCGEHAHRKLRLAQLLVILQRVRRIVRGAQRAHSEFLQNPLRAEFPGCELLVSFIPDGGRGLFIQQFTNAEVPPQFEVSPMVEGIAKRVRHGPSPSQEFLAGAGIASAVAFRHAIGPHGAPFVVVALQPDFRQVAELPVLCDVSRGKMAMIIKNGLVLGVVLEQPRRRSPL